jgi:hypothetical protein
MGSGAQTRIEELTIVATSNYDYKSHLIARNRFDRLANNTNTQANANSMHSRHIHMTFLLHTTCMANSIALAGVSMLLH